MLDKFKNSKPRLWIMNETSRAATVARTDMENATLPPEMTFTDQSLTLVIAYCLCFVVAAVGNLTVFVTLLRSRNRRSRISLMICHLAVADLVVTFIMIPLEVIWRITVRWMAGNLACKILLFLRAFGLYLSSNVLICVSLDRYFAVLYPLRVNEARRRGNRMLAVAWISSVICATPQSFIFHVSPHPDYPDFHQCVTFGFFVSRVDEIIYNLFGLLAMYFIPLTVICWVYAKILREISNKSRETITKSSSNCTLSSSAMSGSAGRLKLRRSDISSIERARSRTLKLTITIVAVFIFCWTPYVAMSLWLIFDRDSANLINAPIQDIFFLTAVGNSCANPLIYGSYSVEFRRECCKRFFLYGSSPKVDMEMKLVRRSTVGSGQTRSTMTAQSATMVPAQIPDRLNSTTTDVLERTSRQEMKLVTNQHFLQVPSIRIPE
ncbi:gonadotropin-releasing hormone II receptor isoform X2 [Cephus cinctus]|uniref:Gonadotropin-releasing hormone II receptor isoform X2 n=1 Tax=Cephus cinctus TaxID=211228 RepID=A0AAJ7RTH6_CEPCN|nr:gonadotropin-releasing hormone II receptor isoform X2 [Cephus cinctus]